MIYYYCCAKWINIDSAEKKKMCGSAKKCVGDNVIQKKKVRAKVKSSDLKALDLRF